MTDSTDVLSTVFIAYSIYAVVLMSLFAWFAYRVTQEGNTTTFAKPALFYTYIAVLVVIGVSIHILTFNKIPWVKIDLQRDNIKVDQTFKINIKKHKFYLPENPLKVQCGKYIKFDLTSEDLTYGFGLIRKNKSLVFQTQVGPGSENILVWKFVKNGLYSIISTEYSGPAGAEMGIKDSVIVSGCSVNDKYSMPGGAK